VDLKEFTRASSVPHTTAAAALSTAPLCSFAGRGIPRADNARVDSRPYEPRSEAGQSSDVRESFLLSLYRPPERARRGPVTVDWCDSGVLMSSALELGPRLRAGIDDLSEVYALLEERSAWLRSKGVAQWNPVYPMERLSREIEAGHVWYWEVNRKIVATVTLFSTRPDYYPPHVWQDTTRAWYIARLAVATRLGGAGIGKRLLNSIEHDGALEELQALRLDVAASNPFLEEYYAALGFCRVATGEIKGAPSVFLEKRLAL
jgi:predicted GNAT family N-acyltransferase